MLVRLQNTTWSYLCFCCFVQNHQSLLKLQTGLRELDVCLGLPCSSFSKGFKMTKYHHGSPSLSVSARPLKFFKRKSAQPGSMSACLCSREFGSSEGLQGSKNTISTGPCFSVSVQSLRMDLKFHFESEDVYLRSKSLDTLDICFCPRLSRR